MRLQLRYIAKPYVQTQKWGVYNPSVYSQFGFTHHNGEDLRLGEDDMIYAPVRMRIVQTGNLPKGAGIFVSAISIEAYDKWLSSKDVAYKVYFTFMHLKKVLCKAGDVLDIGDEFAIADNTGFSTGSHTHLFAGRVNEKGGQYVFVDEALKNYNYSFDHTKYYIGEYAIDYKTKKQEEALSEDKKLENLKYEVEELKSRLSVIEIIVDFIVKKLWN